MRDIVDSSLRTQSGTSVVVCSVHAAQIREAPTAKPSEYQFHCVSKGVSRSGDHHELGSGTRPGPWSNGELEPDLVSVIVPTFNRSGLLQRALDSVWGQDYRPLELLVVDDGSTDNTKDVVEAFAKETTCQNSFSVFYHGQSNGGGQRARNVGLKAARGRYVRFLDSDDWLESTAMRIQVRALLDSGNGVCYGDWIDAYEGESVPEKARVKCSAGAFEDPVASLLGKQWAPNFCYLLERNLAQKVGGWSENYQALQDRDFINRIACTGAAFSYTPVTIGYYCHHHGSRVSRQDSQIWNACMGRIIKDGISFLDTSSQWTEARRKAVAGSLFDHARRYFDSDRKAYRELLAMMAGIDPTFRPLKPLHRWVTSILGFERAETFRRRVKRVLRLNE